VLLNNLFAVATSSKEGNDRCRNFTCVFLSDVIKDFVFEDKDKAKDMRPEDED